MNWPDFTRRSNAIVILLTLDIFFFLATFLAYMLPHAPKDLQSLCAGAFGGISSALLLALKMGGNDVPDVPVTSSKVQTTTTAVVTGGSDADTAR